MLLRVDIMNKNYSEIVPFKNKIWLSSPTMHGDELKWMTDAFEKNWMSTVGENINEVEKALPPRSVASVLLLCRQERRPYICA